MGKPLPLRERFVDVFKNSKETFKDVRMPLVSREIENRSVIHSCYLIAFYGKVEQLFLAADSDGLGQLIQLMQGVVDSSRKYQNLNPVEYAMLKVLIEWLQQIVSAVINSDFNNDGFIHFYTHQFYYRVFRSYSDFDYSIQMEVNGENLYFFLEDTFPLAASIVIMNYEQRIQMSNEINIHEKEFYLAQLVLMGSEQWDPQIQAAYLNGIFPAKIYGLYMSHEIGLRIFIQVEDKVLSMQKILSPQNLNVSAIVNDPFDLTKNQTFRLGYELTIQAQAQLFINNQSIKKLMKSAETNILSKYEQEKNNLQKQSGQNFNLNYDLISSKKKIIHEKQMNLFQLNNENQQIEGYFHQRESELSSLNQRKWFLNSEIQSQMQKFNEERLEKVNLVTEQDDKKKQKEFNFKNDGPEIQPKPQDQQYSKKEPNNIAPKPFIRMPTNLNIEDSIRNIQQKQVLKECCICTLDYEEVILFPCCNAEACFYCVKENYLVNPELKCLQCQSHLKNYADLFRLGLISKIEVQINNQYYCVNPNCRKIIVEENNPLRKQLQIIVCSDCKTQMCKGCKGQKHENNNICNEQIQLLLASIHISNQEFNQQIQNLDPNIENYEFQKKELIKQKRFRFCPKCDNLLFKGPQCEHLDCINCKLSICFTCAYDRSPSVEHGYSCYHRQGCTHYDPPPFRFKQEKHKNCKKCIELDSACNLPETWEQYQEKIRNKYGNSFFEGELAENWIQEQKQIEQFDPNAVVLN